MRNVEMKGESFKLRGLRWSVLTWCILFCAWAQAQEMQNYPLDTINGEEVYVYQVERSIGLYRIGVNFDVPQAEILRLNPQLRERGLHFGETLYLPTGRAVTMKPKVDSQKSIADSLRLIVDSLKSIVDSFKADTIAADTVRTDTIRRDIVRIDSTIPDHRKVVELALMLPFESHQTQKSANAERMMEFYQGSLLALRSLQNDSTIYRLRVYDIERSERRVNALCNSTELDSVRGILGLVYPIQIERMAAWCESHQVPLMLPFSDNMDLANRKQVLQFNSTDEQKADSLFSWMIAHDSTTNCIMVDVRDAEVSAPIRVLRKRIQQSEMNYKSIPLRDLMTDSVGYALDSAKENLFILYSDKFQQIRILLPHLSKLQEQGFKVRIISQYAWQKENIDLPQVYTSIFTTETDHEEYDNLWEQYYLTNHTSDAPRFDLLGYDLMHAMIGWLHGEKEVKGLQSSIRWTQIGEGGWQNEEVKVIEK